MGAVAITQGEALIEIVGDTPAGALAATIQDGERHRPFDFYETTGTQLEASALDYSV
jgi:hypothetical protein